MIPAPLFLIRANGAEFAARKQGHNDAWNEAKYLSFEHGSVEVLRLDGGGRSTVVGRFERGVPVRDVAEVAS